MAEFDLLENLPLFIFILAFFVIFALFLGGGFILLRARGDSQKIEKGRKLLLNSLYGFFIILLIVFVFFLVTYLLKKGEALRPSEVSGEFPSSPAVNFPPSPQFIEIGKYYFTGPWLLKKNNLIKESAIYAVLCKKNEKYDIIYIGETEGIARLLKHKQYNCWMKNCGQKLGNLYVATFWVSSKKYDPAARERIKEELKNQINPPCFPEEL